MMKQLQVMNFLNEIANQFPDAISLASGRPNPKLFSMKNWDEYHALFISYYADMHQCSETEAESLLCQYGPSAGIINKILQQYLALDDSILCDHSQIVVTNGCQEALSLVCLHELQHVNECMLTIDPSYVGFSGLLNAIGKRVECLDVNKVYAEGGNEDHCFNWQYLKETVTELKLKGSLVKAIYINPDFNNPLSYRMTTKDRLSLLDICFELNIKIIEDNPYSRFNYTDNVTLSLSALDKYNIVYHIGSFSKTFCPGVRIGYLVVPDKHQNSLEALISLKSLVSVNTSSYAQSVVGGFLLKNQLSLSRHMACVNAYYSLQRDALVNALHKYCSKFSDVSWNVPQGGFFVVVRLPFTMSSNDVFDCASINNVLCMPVGFFSLNPESWQKHIRLAFSYYSPEVLTEAISRLSEYIERRLIKDALVTPVINCQA